MVIESVSKCKKLFNVMKHAAAKTHSKNATNIISYTSQKDAMAVNNYGLEFRDFDLQFLQVVKSGQDSEILPAYF
jgi:hypothetical protein